MNDYVSDGIGSVTILLANLAKQTKSALHNHQSETQFSPKLIQYPPTDKNPYDYRQSAQYFDSLTEVEQKRL